MFWKLIIILPNYRVFLKKKLWPFPLSPGLWCCSSLPCSLPPQARPRLSPQPNPLHRGWVSGLGQPGRPPSLACVQKLGEGAGVLRRKHSP